MRSAVGTASFRVISSVEGACGAFASNPQPQRPVSRERKAFCRDSLKVRPMAMASPTDFMDVVRCSSACLNFSNVKRGTLVTT